MTDIVLTARDIVKSYGHRHVLQGVSFAIEAGTLVGVVGENGSGKSTLLNILAGALAPNHGAVTITGRLGYCPQNVILNDALTVEQHLDYFRAAYGIPDLARARELLDLLSFSQYRATPISALSGGTKQKLNLTLALMHQPHVLLLDEPYQGFDWETYLRFWQIAQNLRASGCALLVISHLLFEQNRFDALYRLHGGRLERIEPEKESER